ncbi:MAG TPA: succinate dehydrogenase cytochrome b subunit [Bryobacteraceae bacterium]|jgi:succinate dehydrogenase / fumarate reductase cytochrome b subunit|nr:succinate dehydrogenase cytochrome b subunit [Bryobacteraceae bacterium]
MSSTAIGLRENKAVRLWDSTNGKKAVMAVSGCVLFLFVLGHMLGNLQVFEGPEQFNKYAALLRTLPEGLWAVRIILLIMVVLHIVAAVQLALRKRAARPIGYAKRKPIGSTYSSRTMYWSGPIILAFIIYHLLDLTAGNLNPNFIEGDVYHNVIASFSNPLVSAWYIFAMVLLALHLRHGVWSMFQSVGLSHPRYTPTLRRAATAFAVVIFLGFISVPIGVLTGLVK